jgi:hypothetical protein
MKKYKSEEALLTVREPPPKHLSVVSKKGGHTPAEEDRIKNTYTPGCPPKKKRQPKLKAIIFGESEFAEYKSDLLESRLLESYFDKLFLMEDSQLLQKFKDLGTAISVATGIGFKTNSKVNFFIKNFVNMKIPEMQQKYAQLTDALSQPFTQAEQHAIQNKYITEGEVIEYRNLYGLIEAFKSDVMSRTRRKAGIRGGAFEYLKSLYNYINNSGIRTKYFSAISKAEEDLDLSYGEGMFSIYGSELESIDRYRGYRSRFGPGGRSRTGIDSDSDSDSDSEGRSGKPFSADMELKKQRLLTTLQSFIQEDRSNAEKSGLLQQAIYYITVFKKYLETTDIDIKDRNLKIGKLKTRIETLNRDLGVLKSISMKRNLSYRDLKDELRYLDRVRTNMSRTRELKRETEINPLYLADPKFPKNKLENIKFEWRGMTGEEEEI